MLQCKLSRVSHLFASCVFFEYDPCAVRLVVRQGLWTQRQGSLISCVHPLKESTR